MKSFRLLQFFFAIGMLLPLSLGAQVRFNEGVLEYRVDIRNVGDSVHKQGTYTITIKEGNVRKELNLNDAYNNVSLTNFNAHKYIVLQKVNQQSYAVEVTEKEHKKQWAKYLGANYKREDAWLEENVEKPGELPGRKFTIKYKDGSRHVVYVHEQFKLEYPEIFERMPELKGIPVAFEVEMSGGFTMAFRLQKCVQEPVSNAAFRIPEGYRIISRQEYDKIAK